MFIATLIVTSLFAALLAFSASGKLRHDPAQFAVLERVGAVRLAPILALLELAGATGLLIGLAWWPLGAAAGIGVTLYFLGAIASHIRVGDHAISAPSILLAVSLAVVGLRLATT